ncbi:MAG: DNA methyltransferase [Myxococcota bacterium]
MDTPELAVDPAVQAALDAHWARLPSSLHAAFTAHEQWATEQGQYAWAPHLGVWWPIAPREPLRLQLATALMDLVNTDHPLQETLATLDALDELLEQQRVRTHQLMTAPAHVVQREGSLDEAKAVVVLGTNAEVLRALPADSLDCVLEDPPYASSSNALPYLDAFPPGAWASMMRTHLEGVSRCMTPHGTLVLHHDEHVLGQLDGLLRERALYAQRVVWDKCNPKGDAHGVAAQHEYIVWAWASRAALKARGPLREPKPGMARVQALAETVLAAHGGTVNDAVRQAFLDRVKREPDLTGGERAYRYLTDDGRVYRHTSMAWPSKNPAPPSYFTPLVHPRTGQACPVPRRGWRAPPETMALWRDQGDILFGVDHTTQPTRRRFLAQSLMGPVPSVWRSAASDDHRQAQTGRAFAFAKPVSLVQRILAAARISPDDLIFDGFAGSGTTAAAVAASGGRHRVLLVEQSPRIAAEVLLPRMRQLWGERLCVLTLDQAGARDASQPKLHTLLERWVNTN